jgi:hypothetical protein
MHDSRGIAGIRPLAGLVLAGLALGGCSTVRYQTDTTRSATEQLLVTGAIEDAVAAVDLPDVGGVAVSVETVAVAPGAADRDDSPYLHSVLEERLARNGARLVEPEEAELRVIARIGAMGTLSRETFFGIPSFQFVALAVPEIPFYQSWRQRGYTKLELYAMRPDGTWAASSEPSFSRRRHEVQRVLIFSWRHDEVYPPGKEAF